MKYNHVYRMENNGWPDKCCRGCRQERGNPSVGLWKEYMMHLQSREECKYSGYIDRNGEWKLEDVSGGN